MYTKKLFFKIGILNIKKPYFLLGVKLKGMKNFIIIFTQIISFPFSTLLFFSTILHNLNIILTYISNFLYRLLNNLARFIKKSTFLALEMRQFVEDQLIQFFKTSPVLNFNKYRNNHWLFLSMCIYILSD